MHASWPLVRWERLDIRNIISANLPRLNVSHRRWLVGSLEVKGARASEDKLCEGEEALSDY